MANTVANIETPNVVENAGVTAVNTTEQAPFSHMVNPDGSPRDVDSNQPIIMATQPQGEQVAVVPINGDAGTTPMLATIPMGHGLALAGILFTIGLCGVMVRRNFLFMLMSLEIMMNAAALAFIVGGSRWLDPDGQIMFIFILTLAAAEAAIGLAILLQFYHKRGHLDVDSANEMKG